MKLNKFVYKWEKEAIRLRHFEGLLRQQIGDRLGLRFAQVKYIFSKPNVKHYVQTKILPCFWEKEIADIEEKLADPVQAYADDLVKRLDAQTYQWLETGKKYYYSNNKMQMQAISQLGRIMGIAGDQKTLERDLAKAIFKYAAKLETRLQLLRSMLAN
ncbi:MAG: hypothetical protein ACYS30_17495 [Planctomycetota bacterium]